MTTQKYTTYELPDYYTLENILNMQGTISAKEYTKASLQTKHSHELMVKELETLAHHAAEINIAFGNLNLVVALLIRSDIQLVILRDIRWNRAVWKMMKTISTNS